MDSSDSAGERPDDFSPKPSVFRAEGVPDDQSVLRRSLSILEDFEIQIVDHADWLRTRQSVTSKSDNQSHAELSTVNALTASTAHDRPVISQIGFEAALNEMAQTSKVPVASDLDCYVDWCLTNKRVAFPPDAETIDCYLGARPRKKPKPSNLVRFYGQTEAGRWRVQRDSSGAPRAKEGRTDRK